MKIFILIILSLLFCSSSGNAAVFDPAFSFKMIETPHFSIYYHQGLEDIAARAAAVSEEVHEKLTRLLQWEPHDKTHLIIADNSDFANGLTTVVPYNMIYLQTAPPSIQSSLGEYDNWLRQLIIHEYAHVLTSDPVRGYSKTMRAIFGKVFPGVDLPSLLAFMAAGPPNTMMPRWWHEGMSTWAETELTSSGRGSSSYYQMIYRTAVAENNLPDIDIINGDAPYWPGGDSPYIFGSALIQYIAEKHGEQTPGSISRQQSGRFPYFINQPPLEQLNGRDYPAIYSAMLQDMTLEQQQKISVLKEEPFTITSRIGKKSGADANPRYSRDGSMLAFSRNDGHSSPAIVIQDTKGKEIATVRRPPGIIALTWVHDHESIIFSQARRSKEGNSYQDLYRYDLKTEKVLRLTTGMRAAEPDISPDGKTIAAVISGRGGQNIGTFELKALLAEDASIKPKLLTDYTEARISSPRWSPDGKSLLFALTTPNGSSSLQLLDCATLDSRELLNNGSSIDSPAWSADGSKIFFSSDLSGVFNIFSYSPASGKTAQITHLLSGAFNPDISPADQTLVIGEYSSFGPVIATIAKENFRESADTPPAIKLGLYPVNNLLAEPKPPIRIPSAVTPADYSPVPTLLPKFWVPVMIQETVSDVAVGAMTAGQDVLGYHYFLAQAMYGTAFNTGYFDAIYKYGRYLPTFSLHGYALPATYTDLITAGDFTEKEQGLQASVTLPAGIIAPGLSVNGGYHLRSVKPLTEGSLTAYNGKPLFEGRRDSYFAGISFGKTVRYPWSITSEKGRKISLNFEYFGKASGSDLDTREYTASYEEHIPLGGHHNLLARINGGSADGEQTAQQSFRLGGITTFLNPFGLRGYDSFFTAGNRIVTGTLEYRFPLAYLLHGFGTKPLFLDRLHGALFVDGGETWNNGSSFTRSGIMTGAGVELRLDLTIGYWVKVTPAVGYAHGFDKQYGTDQVYFNIYTSL